MEFVFYRKGAKDFLQMPATGFKDGPAEFGKGLAVGTASLLLHSIGGVANTASKITGNHKNTKEK